MIGPIIQLHPSSIVIIFVKKYFFVLGLYTWIILVSGQSFEWTFKSIVAQCMLFMLGGFQVPAAIICFAIYEIAKTAAIQKKLYEELANNLEKSGGRISYDTIREMDYLNKVVLGRLLFREVASCAKENFEKKTNIRIILKTNLHKFSTFLIIENKARMRA